MSNKEMKKLNKFWKDNFTEYLKVYKTGCQVPKAESLNDTLTWGLQGWQRKWGAELKELFEDPPENESKKKSEKRKKRRKELQALVARAIELTNELKNHPFYNPSEDPDVGYDPEDFE